MTTTIFHLKCVGEHIPANGHMVTVINHLPKAGAFIVKSDKGYFYTMHEAAVSLICADYNGRRYGAAANGPEVMPSDKPVESKPAKEINKAQIYKDAEAAMTALRDSMTALLNLQDGLFDSGREESAKEISLVIDSVVSAASRLELLANTDGNICL